MMHFRSPPLLSLLLLWLSTAVYAAETRYVARFSDGSRHEGNALVNWHDVNAQPQLEGRSLLDPAIPFRWLRDRSLSPGPAPTALVELITGDCLPGNVVGYVSGGEDYDPLPAHFVVEPSTPLRPRDEPSRSTIRVVAAQVRRVVWQRRERAAYQSNTLLMRDGRTLSYRAIRFEAGAVSVLTADGNSRIPFSDLAEAHLPAADFWQAYFEELAVLSPQGLGPQGQGRLYQLETTDGLLVTSCKERMNIHAQGGANEPHRWFHGMQPAWSLDILWVPNEKVWLRRSFAPHEVPLSRIPPGEVKHTSTLGNLSQPVQRDRNLADEPLRSGGREWGFGFGMTTTTDLVFDLPVGAKSIRGSIGLDRLAGKGGCAQGRVSAGAKDPQQLWESPVLQGSEQAHDFGPLPCPAPLEKQRLVLRADALHQGRPTGADPLEVRDYLDWLDPIVEFDPVVWMPLIRQAIPRTIPAWSQWQADLAGTSPEKPPKFEPFLDKRSTSPQRFRTGVVLEQPLTLSRKLIPTPQDHWLVMHVSRALQQGNEPRLEARIEGELVGEFKVPVQDDNVRPLVVPLLGYYGGKRPEIDVELTLYSEPSTGPVEWRAIRTAEHLPTLYRVFEEENRFHTVQGSPASLQAERGGEFGVHSLRTPAGSEARITFEKPLRIRERPSWNEYRRIMFWVRKEGRGGVLVELHSDNAPNGPLTLHLGKKEKEHPEYAHVRDGDVPKEWVMIQRDLYADFGPLNVESVTLKTPDGDFALWDHIYFARDEGDVYQVAKVQASERASPRADQKLIDEIAAKAKPALAIIDFGDGRTGNAIMSQYTGELLTAGHLLLAPNRDVKVTLADGRELAGKTRGIWRDADIGLVKLEKAGTYPAVPVNHWEELSSHQFYIAAAHKRGEKVDSPRTAAIDLRRVFKGSAWTNFELPEGHTGGALLSPQGHVVGILSRYSPFGGAEFGLTQKINEVEGRLRNGEVWGKWRAGTGPSFGFVADPQPHGGKILSIDAGGPAAQAGLQVGDIVAKIDGQVVRGLDDVYSALAERDAGHEASAELLRKGQRVNLKLKLAPRMP